MPTIESESPPVHDEGQQYDLEKAYDVADTVHPAVDKLKQLKGSYRRWSYSMSGGMSPETIRSVDKAVHEQEELVDRLSAWAGILYEHPVSSEYASQHPLNKFGYTPEGIAQFEAELSKAIDSLKADDEQFEEQGSGRLLQQTFRHIDHYDYKHSWKDIDIPESDREQAAKEVEDMLNDPNTTLGQLTAKYVEITRQSKARHEKEQFAEDASHILDDIRSGQATSS